MAIGSRAWIALMRRNLVYRKRHFITTGFELLLPVAFLGIVVALKNVADIEDDDIVSSVRSMGFYEDLSDYVALLMTLSLLFPTAAMVRYIVSEKEHRQKELLKMMSVTEADIGWAWFSSFFMVHFVSSALLTLVSKQLYAQASMALLFLFWITSFTAIIVLAMLVGSVFSRAPRATFVGLLIIFFGYFTTLAEDFATGDPTNLRLVSLHPMAAFSYGFRVIGRLEDTREGLSFDNMNDSALFISGMNFAKILRFLFFDTVLWGSLAWYLNRVAPPSYGQHLPLYFLFLRSYWFPSSQESKVSAIDKTTATICDNPDVPVERLSDVTLSQAREGKSIEIHKLKKKFGKKMAIDELSLSIYSGQITALLGVNGAGKSTTINILTGAVAPTEGTAVVMGKNIHTSMQQIRQDMGVCLQHSVIFPSLTAREHIQLFCRIKGLYSKVSYEEAENKVDQALRDVALFDKKNCFAKNLSGGMQRKLSVAMAFCGESPLVILDEPTSGMDPFSRRFTWDVIRRYRQNRTIILTTHQMDEADILGDQVAIMANGRLRCCGGSLFLKKTFGVGYALSIEKGSLAALHPRQAVITENVSDPEHAEAYVPAAMGLRDRDAVLTNIVQDTISDATLLSNAAGEIKFQLPMSASHQFVPVLTRLDDEVAAGNIDSYGLSFTTLEEVFLIASRGVEAKPRQEDEKEGNALTLQGGTALSQEDFERDGLFFRHVQILFLKRWFNFKRDKKAWFFTTILPSLLVFVGFLLFDSLETVAIWFLVVLSFPFITGAFGSFVVSEKQSKAKHLQTIAGVSPAAYWLSTFLWDVLNYQFTLWITIILMFAFDIDDLTTTRHGVVGGVITLLFAFGPAAASFTYCTSFMFSSPAYCNVLNIVVGFLIGFGGTIIVFLLWFFGNGWNTSSGGDDDFQSGLDPKHNLVTAAAVLTWILRTIFPSFCLGNGLFYAINLGDGDNFIKGGTVTSVWDKNVLLYEVIFLSAQSVFYLLLAIQIDKWNHSSTVMGIYERAMRSFSPTEPSAKYETAVDDDVVEEEKRVKNASPSHDLITMTDMQKIYSNGKVAVDKLSLGIPAGECFGLLGINGAGKTTLCSMLTTEFPATSGDARLAGFSIRDEIQETRSRIGYCPQFDALLSNLTGREHVRLYAAIKGTPRKFLKRAVDEKLAAVGLNEFDSDRLAAQYSGGMKRRLTLACATIGQPQLIFLDEPSTGVDPMGRREIWTMISHMLADTTVPEEEKPCVLLTTHSMEECEALCSRIGIMAHGKLRCLGSAQHLKSKFGRGYQLELKVGVPDRNDADCSSYTLAMGRKKEGVNNALISEKPDEIVFNLQEACGALQALTGDTYLSERLSSGNAAGSGMYRDATSSSGVSLAQMAHFATLQLRMRSLDQFIAATYPKAVLRERQDTKARYEIDSEGLSIAHIFETIEANKGKLAVTEYSASQTTLEEIFNFHAAQAEALKSNTPAS